MLYVIVNTIYGCLCNEQPAGWYFFNNIINVYIDLAAERIIAAEKDDHKIAVEIKSFVGSSFMADFHEALDQFLDYRVALKKQDTERLLYLAIPIDIYNAFFTRRFIHSVCEEYKVTLIIFDPQKEDVISWIN